MRLSTSEAGLAALAAGEAGIAMSQREVPENPRGRVVALDALVPMVARGNPVTAIALDDLAGVLSGAITDWGEIGGPPGAPVRVHGLAQGSGLQMQLRSLLLSRASGRFVRGGASRRAGRPRRRSGPRSRCAGGRALFRPGRGAHPAAIRRLRVPPCRDAQHAEVRRLSSAGALSSLHSAATAAAGVAPVSGPHGNPLRSSRDSRGGICRPVASGNRDWRAGRAARQRHRRGRAGSRSGGAAAHGGADEAGSPAVGHVPVSRRVRPRWTPSRAATSQTWRARSNPGRAVAPK